MIKSIQYIISFGVNYILSKCSIATFYNFQDLLSVDHKKEALVGMLYQRAKLLGIQSQMFDDMGTNARLKGVKMFFLLE